MLDFLPAPLKGILAVLLILINTLLFLPLLLLVALAKLVVPVQPFRKACTIVLNAIAWYWIGFNNTLMNLLHRVEWEVRGAEELSKEHWYFVTCNHQSWADIPAIQYVLNSKIPLLKFFLKKQLIWVPLLGVAWWALDFPFMHRHTKEQIAKRPELKGKDIEATKAACEKFRYTPVTIFNFMEGTRFTPEKHQRQNSPYKHLLKPRAGGTAFVFGAMGEMIHTMLDVTIVYPGGRPGIWDYLCGRVRKIVIDIRTREVPERFLGMDYENNREVRVDFQRWVSEIWAEKDQRIETLLAENS
ncbi:1-acyl-sn-glycerol-3-phosphate acyltransferase [Marinobacter nauticus]|jgi:1-acyl-sn-glycerol-3-phosphate acyltransferase|uniref:1-acyl-sn-glycerol-3-phosphate acyltransferase n=1 Tax=Marinobacter nauticus TaxID=2743 RepID=A0A368XVA7_MARNT|nr:MULTISPECIES: acyltransferase [Marinobacter]MCC4270412.1 acyltransferase [Marinobacter nauticus]MCW9011911.1 acyltransferase [Marinobacter sp.]RCW71086.1 1-acyl-sn-glycerol-3-phosphate acyltransferase [Marinobacter nauticus]CCG96040.1 putative Acyltransferase family protein (Phospholipid/glycerol acyltransferase) [Marinobacter nauticus ATCC 49840]